MISDRKIQPKDKYQVWWFPTNWDADSTPHWELAGSYEFPVQAYGKKLVIEEQDAQAEVLVTKTVELEVRES